MAKPRITMTIVSFEKVILVSTELMTFKGQRVDAGTPIEVSLLGGLGMDVNVGGPGTFSIKCPKPTAIETAHVAKLEKNLADEIRILTDERLKRLNDLLGGQVLNADLHDERTNKRLLTKGTELTRDILEKISTRNLKRLRLNNKDLPIEKIGEVEEMISYQIGVLRKITDERIAKLKKGEARPLTAAATILADQKFLKDCGISTNSYEITACDPLK